MQVTRLVLFVAAIAVGIRFLDTLPPPDGDALAQPASSCGNAIIEPGEQCDPPGSITCPPGSPAGAFQACTANCQCPPVTVPPDHFQCYEIKPSFFASTSVTVQDQFGTLTEQLRFPHRLCNPTSKNGEGITDPTDHLLGYNIRGASFSKRTNQTVVDQFGTLLLDVTRPDFLLVPSSKDGVAQQPPLDHFQCYKVKRSRGGPKFTKRTVTISNQFESTTLTLIKPSRLCAPASKNNEDPTASSHPDHLTCYKARGGKFNGSVHTMNNQFGVDDVTVIHRRELCVPSLKNPSTTSTTSTTTTSTSTVTVTTSTSTTSSTVTIPTTTTTTSSTTTTSTTLYGSPNRAFIEPTRSLLD